MQVPGAPDLASKSQAVSDSTSIKFKEETEDSYQMEKIRCLCGSTLPTDSMIKVMCILHLYVGLKKINIDINSRPLFIL